MQRSFVAVPAFGFLLLCVPLAALAHTVTLNWTASSVSGVSYHVWRATCGAPISGGACPAASEGSFEQLGTAPTTTYTDSSVVGNTTYSYYVTAFCPTASSCPSNYAANMDSSPSNHAGAAVPADPVPPPSGLSITAVATRFDGNAERLTASWYEKGSVLTRYTLSDSSGAVLRQRTVPSANGRFSMRWEGNKRASLNLTVCDEKNSCTTRRGIG